MPMLKATDRISHDGVSYEPGEFLDVNTETADILIRAKVAVLHEVTEAVPVEKSEEPVPLAQSEEPVSSVQIDEPAKSKGKAKA